MYDVNYDNYKHSTIIAKNDKIVDWNSKGLSKNLRNKYSKIINPKKRLNPNHAVEIFWDKSMG